MRLYVVSSIDLLRTPAVHSEVYHDRALAASTWRDWAVESEPPPQVSEITGLMQAFVADGSQGELTWLTDPGVEPDELRLISLTAAEVPNLDLRWRPKPRGA